MNDRQDSHEEPRAGPANWWREVIGGRWRKNFRRLLRRIWARRWLLVIVAIVLLYFNIVAGLSLRTAFIGFAVIAGAVALLTRQEMRRPLPSVRQAAADGKRAGHTAYEAVIEALPDPALILDVDGNVLFFNRAAGDLFPTARTSLHMSSLSRNPDLLDAIGNDVALEGPITVIYSERIPVERRMAATIAQLRGQFLTRGSIAIFVSFRDMTEQDRLNQMRADFIANVSHELRTPLASVRGFIETLQGPARDDPEAQQRFLGIMAEQAGRMTRLIDDLLSLSRIEMKAHLIPADEVDIVQTVKYVSATLEPLAKNREIKLTIAAPADEIWVKGDRDELVQVFQNLIQNGLKYGRKSGRVDVEIRRLPFEHLQPGRVSVSVSDNGPGISPEHVPRITERFYRVDVASSREIGGTGLGLAIVKNVVNRHRGELEINSIPGEGSRFTVVLPEFSGTKK